ncbi:MAG: prepilin-type N-terminal cleavage/methylation domain-containing protein [Candidatus Wallbacteria bacterium]
MISSHWIRDKKNNKAFTMLEIIVAVTILAIAFVGIMTHILTTQKGAQSTIEELKAIAYAADMIDRIKNSDYDKVKEYDKADDDKVFTDLGIDPKEEMKKIGGTDSSVGQMSGTKFKREVTVKEIEEKFNGGTSKPIKMKKVMVEVLWKVSNKDDKNNLVLRDVKITLQTLIRKLVN